MNPAHWRHAKKGFEAASKRLLARFSFAPGGALSGASKPLASPLLPYWSPGSLSPWVSRTSCRLAGSVQGFGAG